MVPGPRSRTQGPFADERLAARAWAAKSDTGRDDAHGAIVARPVDATDRSAPSGLEWRTLRRWRTPDSLLLPIAHAITGFLTSEDLTRVKSCEQSPCTLFFLDRTGGQARRWCSLTLCGHRAKQALYRARRRRQKRWAQRQKKIKTS